MVRCLALLFQDHKTGATSEAEEQPPSFRGCVRHDVCTFRILSEIATSKTKKFSVMFQCDSFSCPNPKRGITFTQGDGKLPNAESDPAAKLNRCKFKKDSKLIQTETP